MENSHLNIFDKYLLNTNTSDNIKRNNAFILHSEHSHPKLKKTCKPYITQYNEPIKPFIDLIDVLIKRKNNCYGSTEKTDHGM